MEVKVARQPIFNNNCEVIAYELLYRGAMMDQGFSGLDGDQATAEVVMNSFFNMGFKQISDQKKCFVNFTENLLKSELPFCFPQDQLVIEILENVRITQEVIDTCKLLKSKGYQIALDDYVFQSQNPYTADLLFYADIIKVDILQYKEEDIRLLKKQVGSHKLNFLAEKVETYEDYQLCKELGFDYYQGYFFSKPLIMTSHDTAVQPFKHLELMQELSKREPDVQTIAKMIEQDVSLSYKLLRLINSVAYKRIEAIKSISQAIMLLGINEVKKWSYVLTLKEIQASEQVVPLEAIKLCYIRAKLSERIAIRRGKGEEASSYFLTGMLSLVHIFLQRPIEECAHELPLDEDIRDAIQGRPNPFSDVLQLSLWIEQADWAAIEVQCAT